MSLISPRPVYALMYCPETIKQSNAESNLDWPSVVNTALVTVKNALRDVAEINLQIELAKKLRQESPEF